MLPRLTHASAMRGVSLVEFVVLAPTLLMLLLGVIQSGLTFHAKSNVNYGLFEAARAGTVGHARPQVMLEAFRRAMIGYYGGGRTTAELAAAYAKARADLTPNSVQIEILSPTKESFDDYASPALAHRLGVNTRVIPNTPIAHLKCPLDRPGCPSNPTNNASGQSLQDANLLKLRITYGIPAAKQVPLVGRLYVMVLRGLSDLKLAADPDPFRQALLAQGRIPVVSTTVMRMQSEAFEDGNASIPGAGNGGNPVDPDEDNSEPPDDNPPVEDDEDDCNPLTDLNGCRPTGCRDGDPACDPTCDIRCCTTGSVLLDGLLGKNGENASTPNASSIPGGLGVFTQG